MSPPPQIPNEPQRKDSDHLRLLSVFHYVLAGFSLFGIGFLIFHYMFMNAMFTNPAMWENGQGNPPPEEFFSIFVWFYVFMGLVFVAGAIANVLSGVFMKKRKHRIYSLVLAGINCLSFPFGTVLGVFTFIVLLRDSVQRLYGSDNPEDTGTQAITGE